MGTKASKSRQNVHALKVRQWMTDWDKVSFNTKTHRRKPDPHFYVFSLPARELKALSGISRREAKKGVPRSRDLGIQRRHDELRSKEIAEYVRYGYPWSDLSEAKRKSDDYNDLRKPGWLPTAIVVNIHKQGDERRGRKVSPEDLMNVAEKADSVLISLPTSFKDTGWAPRDLHPIEVIDGQHRLWAFEEEEFSDEYELPVVAFHGLDISWQAYLFWTINIKPKRINASLAFDLYPLLRTEDWLEKFEGHSIYRETRAQELVEALWVNADSPWYQWINMLGESGLRKSMVSQAAWVRSLMATFVKSWEGKGVRVGGLFGAPIGKNNEEMLAWSRAQQAAFLILVGSKMRDAVGRSKEAWATSLRKSKPGEVTEEGRDAAFYGPHSLFTTDQGIRGFLNVTNDLFYIKSSALDLQSWQSTTDAGAVDEKAVSDALKSLRGTKIEKFMDRLADSLADYDWRTSAAPGLSESQRILKTTFRGGSGYKELRRQLLQLLSKQSSDIGESAAQVSKALGISKDGG